jgi:uncharacterized protein (DUF305 family)
MTETQRAWNIAAPYTATNELTKKLAAEIDQYVEDETKEGQRICRNWSQTYDDLSRTNMSLRGDMVKMKARMMRMSKRFALVVMFMCLATVVLSGLVVWMSVR